MFSYFSLNINVKSYAIPSKPRLLNDEVIDFEKLLIIQIILVILNIYYPVNIFKYNLLHCLKVPIRTVN